MIEVGDKLKVITDFNKKYYNGVQTNPTMEKTYSGKMVTISSKFTGYDHKGKYGVNKYKIQEDDGFWTWTEEMFNTNRFQIK